MSRGAARSGTRRRRRAQRKHHSPAAPHRAPRHAASQQRRAEPQSHLPRYQPPQITGPQERVRVREHPPHRRPVHPGQPPPPEDHGDEQSADGAPRPEPLRLAGDVLSRGRGCISGVRICRWGVARRRGGAGWVRVAPHQRVSLLVELLVHAPQHGHPAPTLAYLVPEVLGELLGSLPQRRGLRGGVVAVANGRLVARGGERDAAGGRRRCGWWTPGETRVPMRAPVGEDRRGGAPPGRQCAGRCARERRHRRRCRGAGQR